jgi:hypothetical protein
MLSIFISCCLYKSLYLNFYIKYLYRMSKKGGGVVPFVTAGFPNGAGSAKQAVQMEINNQNKIQADANMIVGGLQHKQMRERRTARHRSAKGSRRTARRRTARRRTAIRRSAIRKSARHGSAKGARRRKAQRSAKGARRIYRGGLDSSDNTLVDGEQLAVPQFGPSVGPLNPNSASVLTNSILLKSQQDSVYDKQI